MAERLPRYRRTGVSPTAVPSVSTRGLNYRMPQMQISDPFAGITSALDKMTEFAFERAAKKAKKEGVEFRMENPITSDQISAAMSQGRDIDEIVGDPDTIFGSASRATASAQLKTELEANARNEIAAISAALNSDVPINPDEVQVKIQSVIDGHADILAQVNPSASYSYRGTISTIAAPVYKLALEKEYKRAKLAGQLSLNNAMDQAPAAMQAAVMASAGGFVEINGKPVPELEQSFAVIRRTLMDQAVGTGDLALIKNTQEKILKMEEKAKVDGLRQFARENPSLVDVYSGNYGRLTSVYAGLSEDNKEIVREKIIEERSAENKAAKDRRTEADARSKSNADRNYSILFSLSKDSEEYVERRAQYERDVAAGLIGREDQKALEDRRNPKRTGSKEDYLQIFRAIEDGKFRTFGGLRGALDKLDLSIDQKIKLENQFEKERDDDYKEAKRALKTGMGLIGEMASGTESQGVLLLRASEELEDRYKKTNTPKAVQEGASQSYVEIAKGLVKEGFLKAAQEAEKNQRESFFNEAKRAGIDIGNSITSQNFETIKQKIRESKASQQTKGSLLRNLEAYKLEHLELK
jgi:hypothetical protein